MSFYLSTYLSMYEATFLVRESVSERASERASESQRERENGACTTIRQFNATTRRDARVGMRNPTLSRIDQLLTYPNASPCAHSLMPCHCMLVHAPDSLSLNKRM